MALGPSAEQRAVARQLGVVLQPDDTFDIAAARILDVVAPVICLDPCRGATERQISFATSLGLDVSTDSKRVASARITGALVEKNARRIAELGLKPGDRVLCVKKIDLGNRQFTDEREFVISSIHPHGRIFFKGPSCQGAWPDEIRKLDT